MLVVLLRRRVPGLGLGPRRGRDDEGARSRRRSAPGSRGSCTRRCSAPGARTRASCSCSSGPRSRRSVGGVVILAASARVADRGAARLSSGSWSTSSADRAARDGQPARGRPGATAPPVRPTSLPGMRSSRQQPARLLPPARRLGAGQGRQRLVAPVALLDGDRAARRRPGPPPAARPAAVGVRLRAARPGARRRGTPTPSARFTDAGPARPARRGPADRATSGSTPRSRPTALTATPTAPSASALARRRAGARQPPIQPTRPGSIDLAADEDALWGDLRKKWRQYVNKARTGGVRVVDAGAERLDEFYGSTARPRTGPAS